MYCGRSLRHGLPSWLHSVHRVTRQALNDLLPLHFFEYLINRIGNFAFKLVHDLIVLLQFLPVVVVVVHVEEGLRDQHAMVQRGVLDLEVIAEGTRSCRTPNLVLRMVEKVRWSVLLPQLI